MACLVQYDFVWLMILIYTLQKMLLLYIKKSKNKCQVTINYEKVNYHCSLFFLLGNLVWHRPTVFDYPTALALINCKRIAPSVLLITTPYQVLLWRRLFNRAAHYWTGWFKRSSTVDALSVSPYLFHVDSPSSIVAPAWNWCPQQ